MNREDSKGLSRSEYRKKAFREKLCANSDRILCFCGKEVSHRSGLSAHFNTKFHTKWYEENKDKPIKLPPKRDESLLYPYEYRKK